MHLHTVAYKILTLLNHVLVMKKQECQPVHHFQIKMYVRLIHTNVHLLVGQTYEMDTVKIVTRFSVYLLNSKTIFT